MMQPLDKPLRNKLEKTVKEAREVAEDAARAALEQLGVGEAAPFAHLSEQDRELRRKLRVHGRQLGDSLNGGKIQTMDRLIEEVAYEHWHRMLFARFLAENNLLMYPDPDDPVAVTLEECEDLAADEGAANGWELAARFAARMLPQIFRLDSPVFQLVLPPEHQQKLERLVADLPQEVFTASDSLGWVYQFWQAKKKDEVNASEVKIGARELPAVTQLFTEPYMVSFLLDNSLGAWWAARRLSEADLQNASSEEELRRKAAIPGVPLDYLRFVQQEDDAGNKRWTPAAGTFDDWPEQLADLKTLDPCCGSGHFLVAAFLMLVPMRMERDGLSAREAVDAVLRENIHGLELDQRCVELAAFALALTAWKYPDLPSPSGRGAGGEDVKPIGYRMLPELNVACSGLSVSVAKEEWKQLGLGKKNLIIALDWMHDTFKDAPVLGSLLDPAKSDAAKLVLWNELSSAMEQALKLPSPSGRGVGGEGYEQREAAVVAQGLVKAATLLAGRYHWVITNVPYLARGKQSERLRDFCEKHYPEAKNDLATVFLDRCLELPSPPSPPGRGGGDAGALGGTVSVVLPQNWLFLTSYKKFREKLLNNDTWHLIARLGEGGFDSSAAAGAFVAMITLSRGNSTKESGGLFGDVNNGNLIRGVDVSEPRTAAEKAAQLRTAEIKSVEQAKQLENPDCIVQIENTSSEHLFSNFATCLQGTSTGDNFRFVGCFWEIETISGSWQMMEAVSQETRHTGGKQSIIRWDEIQSFEGSSVRGWEAFGNKGIAIGQMRELPATIYTGRRFPNTTPVVIPKEPSALSAIWTFCMSESFSSELRKINQKLSVDNGYVGKIPFDLDHWTKVAAEKYPNGLPKPYTDDPTQWIFHGHPCGSVIWDEEKKWTAHGPLRTDDTVLQVAVARLLGYRWPAEGSKGVPPLKEPDRDGLATMELADEQREWVKRCDALAGYADDDGIVCIPPVRGEASASDRLLNLLAAAYGGAWSNDTLAALLKSADHAGKTLETWLREKFFTQHCKLFQHRPFIWHIWDGLRDGFAALVNYHKLDRKNLETLIYTYLGDWISRQKQDIASGVDGAQERLAAAKALKKKLEMILEGEAPCDIFVRWKPIEQQPIGWNPDLNDGVRLNIRPFMTVPDVGKKGAGVLRDKPNITWNKDRGKDVESAPWYHLFKGDRINDHHLTLAEKRAAREKSS
ncbi:BREX-1 system adenine-specific DNA-methyltransferase PglX [Desulfatirhabdium butyrativorans]|uniref:BREX-1 system adenine-specific DNA-methyltransferase PglX n=1 Tax=Desulfatirhabdium butyrativorans TaxID=340467 RepID=UPI0004292A81|nr:BREX-1 system adenine-specific DNA-methyltransferase PglX [Desulfatirhabdium butyrativorans]